MRAGHYVIEVRSWPRELDLPLGATYTHLADNREKAKGRAIPGIQKARLRIGGVDRTIEVDASAVAARFEVDLARGPAELQKWLISQDGFEREGYFVYVERSGL